MKPNAPSIPGHLRPLSDRHVLFECPTCHEMKEGADFVSLTEVPPIQGRTYHRTAWRKRVINIKASCRACRARANARQYNAKQKEKAEAIRLAEVARIKARHEEIPIHLLPKPERTYRGGDPVLRTVANLLANARQSLRAAKEGVAARTDPVTEGNKSHAPQAGCSHVLALYRARVAVFKMVRHQRHIDLMNPLLVNDPQRMHWLYYVPRDIRHELDDLAAQANRTSARTTGRPFTGLPKRTSLPSNMATEDGLPAREALARDAWAALLENVRLTRVASKTANRNKARRTGKRRIAVYADDQGPMTSSFTLEEFHLKRIAAADAAEREIEHAIENYEHPSAWTNPWTGTVEPATSWRQLVPPYLRDELEQMWRALPEGMARRMRAFPRLTKDRRNRMQKELGLNAQYVRPARAPHYVTEGNKLAGEED